LVNERVAMATQLNEKLKKKLSDLCRNIAGSRRIIAVCVYGPWVCGYADEKTEINVLMILDQFTLRLNTYFETIDDVNVSILTVNTSDFERDVNKSWLGEFFAEKITVPYEPLLSEKYLRLNEVKIKKRITLELLEKLISEFPESSQELLIKKEYFMYEIMMRRAKVFPPLTYSYLNMLHKNLERKNVDMILNGYLKVFEELEKENVIFNSDSFIKITRNHINSVRKRKQKLPLFLKSIQRFALPPILSVFSESASFYIQDQRLFMKTNRKARADGLISRLEDPKNFILLPTPLGMVSLSDKSDIKDVARKIIPNTEFSKMKLKSIGGAFNSVYVLSILKNGEEQKFVVKQFLDWSNLKWISLALWSFGTTSFSVLGRSRLEKEYAINVFLHGKGFPVPKIFSVSLQNRLIFEEFIEGKELVETIKRIMVSERPTEDLLLVKDVGRKIAEAHNLGISLGDCKPENFIVTKDGFFFLDLEQANRNQNYAWDIAEFLYYSGHYSPPISSAINATNIASKFIEGYLEGGGKKENVKKAGSPKYTKLFSVFTPPHVLLAISNICQQMGK
jgi:tRNA A-37 threonylcarbamoyl transferase component Bud32